MFNPFDPISTTADIAGGIAGDEFTSGGGTASDDGSNDAAMMMYLSDNNKAIALQQVNAQMFALQQGAVDRELQRAATLELGMEKLDTKLQMSKLDYVQRMTSEENRHVEKMAEARNKLHKIQSTHSTASGIPEPDFTEDK